MPVKRDCEKMQIVFSQSFFMIFLIVSCSPSVISNGETCGMGEKDMGLY